MKSVPPPEALTRFVKVTLLTSAMIVATASDRAVTVRERDPDGQFWTRRLIPNPFCYRCLINLDCLYPSKLKYRIPLPHEGVVKVHVATGSKWGDTLSCGYAEKHKERRCRRWKRPIGACRSLQKALNRTDGVRAISRRRLWALA